ncbi:MAG TPA: DUF1801 domain-containing protein [Flavobacteriales bacterium]|jgi:hypothetical protein|nr:DUF1801 domain-containing protein [Flavobacteriales bacterium]HRO38984.1 DUF1801 domain-containing protein [Flavobacteriales bacterium]HRP81463.1 DUF1801 domain-containing protein [Flavobacteriales bacterium]HRQ85254.1 DUF1801 domain-containing protein [Flavobacteriales bacterium]
MAELKTRQTGSSVDAFIANQPDPFVRKDCRALVQLMQQATNAPPKMWGPSIIGFGSVKLKYATGREVDWMQCGFSPRMGKISLYLNFDIQRHADLLSKLGKHSTGKGCLYIKRMADVDKGVLEQLIQRCQVAGACLSTPMHP